MPVRGVKGHSIFSKIMPDFIKGICIDRMHGVDGGVAKKLYTLFFDKTYREFPFSLHNVIDTIDAKLKIIKPPKFVHRMPRSVTDIIHWKASELKMFFFYFSIPVFEGVMRLDYFEHYLRLVTAITILSSDNISEDAIAMAENLLHRFLREFEVLYGLQFCTINFHQLMHLPDCVRNFGPLWAYSCYEYENINGELLKLIHGTWHIDTQIANSQSQFIKMIRLIEELPEGKVRNFCISRKKQVKIIESVSNKTYSVGTYKKLQEIPQTILNAFEEIGLAHAPHIHVYQYLRLLKDERLYVSSLYRQDLQTQYFVVQFSENQNCNLGKVHCFVKISTCNCNAECNCVVLHYAIIERIVGDSVFLATGDHNFSHSSVQFLQKCHDTNHFVAIPIQNLLKVCILIKLEDQMYVAMPINDKELE